MLVIDTAIPEVKIIEPRVYEDDRGYFYESFSDEWFRKMYVIPLLYRITKVTRKVAY